MLSTLAPTGIEPVNGHPLTAHPLAQDPDSPGPEAAGPLGAGWLAVVITVGVMAALIAVGGMLLSFRAVSTEMAPAFGASWAWLVPIVVDLTVFVFSGVDLVLARLDMSHPLARLTVYGATAGTVFLNYSAGGNLPGRVAHILMPSIWVVFVELMRHIVRHRVGLATGTQRQPIPAARWIVSPWPTLKLWRRMVLWRVHSYPAAVAMERTRLGAVATARQLYGRTWRYRISPLVRLQITLGEIDAAAITTLATDTTADTNPDNGPDTTADSARTAKRTPGRTRSGQSTAAKVAALADKHPDMSAAAMAKKLGVTDRTVRRHLSANTGPTIAANPAAA